MLYFLKVLLDSSYWFMNSLTPQPTVHTETHKGHFHLLTTLSRFTFSLNSPWWSSSIHLSPLWIPSVGVLGSQVMLTFSCLFSSIGESVNRMEGGLAVFLMGCQLSPYTWTLWILGIPQEFQRETGVLSLTWWTQHLEEKSWKIHWITPSSTRGGWPQPAPCSHDLSSQTQTYTCTLTNTNQAHFLISKRGFSGLVSVASWPRPYRGREGMEGVQGQKYSHKANWQEM